VASVGRIISLRCPDPPGIKSEILKNPEKTKSKRVGGCSAPRNQPFLMRRTIWHAFRLSGLRSFALTNLYKELFMKKTILAVSLAAMTLPAMAQKAAEPAFSISGNVSLVSDYRFRGISQTDKDPAIQGGFDLAHKSGLYIGTWASNVSEWANTGGSMELDIYAGYSSEFAGGIGYDIGYIAYRYPGNKADPKNNTAEWYVGLSYGPVSYKFSKARTDWFGVDESKGSYYHSLGFEFSPIDKLTLSATAGKQKIKGDFEGDLSFKDYSIGASYDLGDGFSVGLTATKVSFDKSSAKENWFDTRLSNGGYSGGAKLYENATVLSLTKEF
jgi:uncharacterized protein (TIGR02001 family)